MAKPDTWMPLYIADYLADTAHLTTEEHGAYLLLLMHHWRRGNLPKNEKKLAKIAQLSCSKFRKISDTILEFFTENEDHYIHDRVAQEIEKANKKYEARARAGQAGGIAKAKQKSSNAKAKRCQPQPQPQTTNVVSDTSYHSSACEGGFDYFWKVYPRKKAKAHALKAWRQAVKKTSPQEIIFAAEQYRDRTKGAEARYIKHPATWLNGECWHDEPDPDPSDNAEFERRAAILAGLGLAGPGGLDAGPGGSENCHDGAIECGTERGNGSLEADRQAGPSGVAGSVIQFRGGVQPEGQPEGSDADIRPSLSILPGGPSGEGGERDTAKLERLGQTSDASGDVGICFTGTDAAQADGKQDTPSHSTQAPGATGTHADRPEGAGCVDGQTSQAFPDLPAFLDRRARA